MRLDLLRICTQDNHYTPKELPNSLHALPENHSKFIVGFLAIGLPSENRLRAATRTADGDLGKVLDVS